MINKALKILRASQELGPSQILSYAQYRIGYQSGFLAHQVLRAQARAARHTVPLNRSLLPLPDRDLLNARLDKDAYQSLIDAADAVCIGNIQLFGSIPARLNFPPVASQANWSHYEGRSWLGGDEITADIKFTWEPARFGWALTLARAYWLSRDERYAEAFWHWSTAFFTANPPGAGLQWTSAQEVGLRLICLVFAWQVFSNSQTSTPERAARLSSQIAQHAARIPASLNYARAQNNNHLLSEAAALYTAGLALAGHPQAEGWKKSGWRVFHAGLRRQIAQDGTYSQHSTNYHRLMLQLCLWVHTLSRSAGSAWPEDTFRLANRAVDWLAILLDPVSGRTPNLGPNDGAYILPLSSLPYADYRPVLQAASRAFCSGYILPPGSWDEMDLWLNGSVPIETKKPPSAPDHQGVIRSPSGKSWAYLRAVQFQGRPGHADQLHVDLWWRGLNLALDPGTYLYNAPSPWDNRLVCAQVHNTVTINGHDQMQRAGRFLYLQAAHGAYTERLISPDKTWERLTARHSGYKRLPASAQTLHVRTLTRLEHNWQVEDQLLPASERAKDAVLLRLHWLLPDWPWRIETENGKVGLLLTSPEGEIQLILEALSGEDVLSSSYLLCRAGERIAGEGAPDQTWGWHSPTYGVKQPALSLSYEINHILPVIFTSRWILPED